MSSHPHPLCAATAAGTRLACARPALEAQFTDPHGISIRPDGMLIFADSFNYRVVKVEP